MKREIFTFDNSDRGKLKWRMTNTGKTSLGEVLKFFKIWFGFIIKEVERGICEYILYCIEFYKRLSHSLLAKYKVEENPTEIQSQFTFPTIWNSQ